MTFSATLRSFVGLTLSSSLGYGQTIIDDHFDDGEVTGWKSVGNSLGADHTITEEGTLLTSEVVGTEANLNTNRGIVSEASFDPTSRNDGFTMTFEVASQGETDPGANGLFLGVVTSDETFFRLDGVLSFGLVFYGLTSRTDSDFGVSLVTNDIGAGGPAAEGLILSPNPDTIELISLQDGFTATVSADSVGWSFSVTGVNDLVGDPTEVTGAGTWAESDTTYEDVFGGSNTWYVLASNQGNPVSDIHTVVYDRISLVQGQPAESDLSITSIQPNLGGEEPTVTLTWSSLVGAEYAVEVTTDLATDTWLEVTDGVLGEEGETEFVHELLPDFPDLVDAGRLFYRVRQF